MAKSGWVIGRKPEPQALPERNRVANTSPSSTSVKPGLFANPGERRT